MKVSGVYKIQSISHPERCYIGSAVNIKKRWREHIYQLKNNKHHSPQMQNHYNKYGKADLEFSVLLGCERDDLLKSEQYFLDSYKPYFNCSPTAGSTMGYKRTPEQIAPFIGNKYGVKNKGNKRPDLSEMNRKRTGQKASDETKEKHRKKMMGNTYARKQKNAA